MTFFKIYDIIIIENRKGKKKMSVYILYMVDEIAKTRKVIDVYKTKGLMLRDKEAFEKERAWNIKYEYEEWMVIGT